VCPEKEISITYFECALIALGIQHAMRMRHILICPPPQYFPTLSNKGHDFQNICIERCVFGFSVQRMSETFLILRIPERDMNKIVY